jgi:uncharacterized repeat protein (TIGR03803 family)
MRKLQAGRLILALSLLLGLVALEALSAHARTFTVLYNFAGPPDGGVPYAALLYANGTVYGTTYVGGTGVCTIQFVQVGCGTVFKVTGNKEIVLHNFKGTPDGANPIGGLVRDALGNLYGTTIVGGAYNSGTVFKLTGRKETILYSFKGKPDGAYPFGTLLPDASGDLYGTTENGGANGGGTVFKLDPSGNETVLYSFCSNAPQTVTAWNGANPEAALIVDAKGNLYGTTPYGGGTNAGTVFKLDANGNETALYSFCPMLGSCVDGAAPKGALVMDARGNLYGATPGGGTGVGPSGTVFKLDAGSNETVLHSFCSEGGCADGGGPVAGLIMDGKGNLYGTAVGGGRYGGGTVFKMSRRGAFSVLHSFTGFPDPVGPIGGLVMDAKGNLYGTTSKGGPGNCTPEFGACGAVFKITP